MKRVRCMFFLLSVIVVFAFTVSVAAENEAAEDLTQSLLFDFGDYRYAASRVLHDQERYQVFSAGASFSFFREEMTGARLCLQWRELPQDVRVLQHDADGQLLEETALPSDPETVTDLLPETNSVTVQAGSEPMKLMLLKVYGPGELPDPFHLWNELPDYIDYLLISTHPDDDVLYLGSVVPTYGAEQGLIGSIAYVTCASRQRMSEAENGAWAMGLRYRPIFMGFPDIPKDAPQEKKDTFIYRDLVQELVRLYRAHRPVVVFAQDEYGEYGHWQHILSSKAAREAFVLAVDPAYDSESVERYGTWQVQKLYLHQYQENEFVIDADSPLLFFNGETAFQVAKAAYKKHESQQRYGFSVEKQGRYAFNRFGMSDGVVPAGNDAFANIEPQLLSNYVPEIVTPAPTEPPIVKPTEKPMETPEASQYPSPTEMPDSAEKPEQWGEEKASGQDRIPIVWIAVAAALAAGAIVLAAIRYGKKKE